ncbi:unnamed protein product [Paramecium octaurelia]|uniref:Uncharacterized protein n=1 Tax=Paramecium octaurelia TaxID=43137 RepID=A0A8S1W9X9_PAROT|nr:unnamed protein product [Paramecium octaurelia]
MSFLKLIDIDSLGRSQNKNKPIITLQEIGCYFNNLN